VRDPKVLIAGVGNIFLGDDAFGSEVARQMTQRMNLANVHVVDFGIRALDLVYALMEGYDMTVIVDATARGGKPGTIYVIEPDFMELESVHTAVEAHAMDPVRVLALARSMGADLKNVRIVGCEPETFGPENEGMMGLSPRVAVAVEDAIRVIQSLISLPMIVDFPNNQEASA
jgi:hydrogenase maturation protease